MDADRGGVYGAEVGVESRIVRGRYRIIRPLGSGGMGSVHLAADALEGGRLCAIKELRCPPGFSAAEVAEAQERFAREGRLLASLSHPTLPQVYDVFAEDGRSYLVMEYVEGETLERRVEREGPQPETAALGRARQTLAALDYLHAQTPPIIFRDIAPDNLMLTPGGEIKLIDFGIARVFNPVKQTDTLRFGKVGYAPPEQFGGGGQTAPYSDLYALGATLHYLLTGRDPAQSPFVFPPLRALRPDVSETTERAVAWALQLDPALRPADARALANALGHELPPLVLPPRPATTPGALAMPPAPREEPRSRLVVFHVSRRFEETLKRQRRLAFWMMGGMVTFFVALFGVMGLTLGRSIRGGYSPFPSQFFPLLFVYLIAIMLTGLGAQGQYARRRRRVRLVLGRGGILFLPRTMGGLPFGRPKMIPWDDVVRVEDHTITLSGPLIALYVRRGSKVRLGFWAWLLARGSGAKARLRIPTIVYEQMALDQSPVPAMTLGEALSWYREAPHRRAELADLPPIADAATHPLLRAPDEPAVVRWVGVPAWASLGLVVAIYVAREAISFWISPDFVLTPAFAIGFGIGAGILGLTFLSLGLVLARAVRRGALFKLGATLLALSMVALGVFTVIAPVVDDWLRGATPDWGRLFSFPSAFNWIPFVELGFFYVLALIGALVGLWRESKEEAALSYSAAEMLLLVVVVLLLAVVPGTIDFFSSVTSQTIKGVFEPVRDFALRPHLALFVITLGYFQGATPRWQRLATLAILLCGLGMIVVVPGLYIGADWELARWRLLLPITPRDVAILAIYFGLNVVAGALVVAGAWRRLRSLDPHGRALSWLWRRRARATVA